jgi:acetyltransferase-like isoleucine patch superfamily enzyme
MEKTFAQAISRDDNGFLCIEDDWFGRKLPENIFLDEMSYPDTSYSFSTFFSRKPNAFSLGYASGNYGHGIFTTGVNGQISIGKFVVLQCTRIISNRLVTIGDHCMFSWGSVVTDSWVAASTLSASVRKDMLEALSRTGNRHLEFDHPRPVLIEENVWVGFEAVILPGVTVGRGAVVGCKTVVTEDVPPYAVVAGNPARVIRFIEPTDTPEAKQAAFQKFLKSKAG